MSDLDYLLLIDSEGHSLYGTCGHCQRQVDNFDIDHRVSAILRGGKGVECVIRGDIDPWEGHPLRESV